MYFGKGTRTENNKEFMKIYTLYKSMMQRCYLETSGAYENYGAIGVTVCDRWKGNLDNFIEDVDSIDGFDMYKLMNREIQLDKDIKQIGCKNKVYSKETCIFVSVSENCENRRNNRNIMAINLRTGDRIVFKNIDKFCRDNKDEHGFNSRTIQSYIDKEKGSYKGFQFLTLDTFDESKVNKLQIIEAIDSNNQTFRFNSVAIFAKENNLSSANISMVLSGKNKTHKGWKFKKIQDGVTLRS